MDLLFCLKGVHFSHVSLCQHNVRRDYDKKVIRSNKDRFDKVLTTMSKFYYIPLPNDEI